MAKVILTHEVNGLGSAGDVVDVKDGYATNFLVPRKLATPWSAGAEKSIDAMRKARRAREVANVEEAHATRDSLQSKPIVVDTERPASPAVSSAPSPRQTLRLPWLVPRIDKRGGRVPHQGARRLPGAGFPARRRRRHCRRPGGRCQ